LGGSEGGNNIANRYVQHWTWFSKPYDFSIRLDFSINNTTHFYEEAVKPRVQEGKIVIESTNYNIRGDAF